MILQWLEFVLCPRQKKSGAQVRPSTSGSSRELSEEDEVEGENETMENMDPSNSKRVRR